ncbi:phospholipid scramblase 3-like [Plodia interpunctella]|uniref:phospholipid scramblase 3-like n=1 Tax=Plodia interpunctella TaxID=58824 RepID=UPI0023689D73|nr:phospholipid scramblase 3-like [Plodia interpunctella]
MAGSQYPRGLQELAQLPTVLIHQKTSVRNKYRILSPDGREVMYAKEDSSLLHAMFSGKDRSFHIDIFDADNVEIINLRRPYTFGADKMEVTVGKQLAGIVRQEVTFLKPVITVNDASDRPVMRVKGPVAKTGPCKYDIFDRDKRKIGEICKKWGGFARETFTDADSFEIVFPPNVDLRLKASLLGACLLIDFLYYER